MPAEARTITLIARVIVALAAAAAGLLVMTGRATAGDYYVYGCSSYGNTAPAFTPFTNAAHLAPADACMQPAPGGGFRSLELNNPPGGQAPVLRGYGANWTATSPSPAISIIGAYTPVNTVLVDCWLRTDGFTAQFFWDSGTQAINYINGCNSYGYGYGTGINITFAPSTEFGWGGGCWLSSSCSTSSSLGAVLGVNGIRLTAEEDSGPSVVPDGSNNLWYQAAHWVRGGGWPVTFTASDPSGVCGTDLLIHGGFTSTDLTSDGSPDSSSFTQCWPTDVASGTLDTTAYPDGPVSIMYAATNAAGVLSNPSETIQIDNTPVSLALSTPNDADPNVWVNHAVSVIASASAGPSGLGGTSCSTNDGQNYDYPSSGISLDGTGVWTVACASWNNAFDVNGQPATSSTETVTVHIDETPPTVAFRPQDPSDPQALVADTSDAQSGVASGQIQMRPASGGSWSTLGTQLTGSQLRARFDDATLPPGDWVVEATSCDNAGNCSSTQERLSLPVRAASTSTIGLGKLQDTVMACSIRRKRHGRHRRRHHHICRSVPGVSRSDDRVRFGAPVLLSGRLTTGLGSPVADTPLEILTAPDNGNPTYSRAASVTTNSAGIWSVELPAGPSRLISAIYDGSPTVQPSQASIGVVVPASVRVLRVWPRRVRWGRRVHIKAQLAGGFLPSGGALVRLRLGYGNAKITYGVQEHVGGDGIFEVTNTFGPGPSGLIRHYWLQECTLPEGDYPFAPACSRRSRITVGG